MNENLPQKYKNNIFSNILIKIRSLFHKKDFEKENKFVNNKEYEKDNVNSSDFFEQIKYNLKNNEYEKKNFMEKFKENPELLQGFSNDRLKIILQYYLDENQRKRELLRTLKV